MTTTICGDGRVHANKAARVPASKNHHLRGFVSSRLPRLPHIYILYLARHVVERSEKRTDGHVAWARVAHASLNQYKVHTPGSFFVHAQSHIIATFFLRTHTYTAFFTPGAKHTLLLRNVFLRFFHHQTHFPNIFYTQISSVVFHFSITAFLRAFQLI